jgi:hypothetical protein
MRAGRAMGVTLFGIFLTPVFFYVIQWFGGGQSPASPLLPAATPPAAAAKGVVSPLL